MNKQIFVSFLSIFSILFCRAQQAGDPDISFGSSGKAYADLGFADFTVIDQEILSDGSILLAGSKVSINLTQSDYEGYITKLDANGNIDTQFNGGNRVSNTDILGFSCMRVQPDGKIIVGGNTQWYGIALARYNEDGTLDETFGIGGQLLYGSSVYGNVTDIKVYADGRILVVSQVSYNNINNFRLSKLNPDGSPDTTFNNTGSRIVDYFDYEYAYRLEILPDGKFVVGGEYFDSSTHSHICFYKFNEDGTSDFDFGINGCAFFFNAPLNGEDFYAMDIQPDNKIIFSAKRVNYSSASKLITGRINTDGSIDTGYGTNGITSFNTNYGLGNTMGVFGFTGTIKCLDNGEILLSTDIYNSTTQNSNVILLKYTSAGQLATAFNGMGYLNFSFLNFRDFAPDFDIYDNKIFLAGHARGGNAGEKIAVAKFNMNGAIDDTFAANGKLFITFPEASGDFAAASTVLPDGKIITCGGIHGDNDFYGALVKYNSDGSIDTTFGNSGNVKLLDRGIIKNIAVQPDGKIVTWNASDFGIYNAKLSRFNADGTPDSSFASSGSYAFNTRYMTASDIKLQADNKIVICGRIDSVVNNYVLDCHFLARFNSDGTPDTSFGTAGRVVMCVDFDHKSEFNQLIIQPDGKMLVLGHVDGFNDSPYTRSEIMRFNTDGTIDNTFNAEISNTSNSYIQKMRLLNDGRILLLGTVFGNGEDQVRATLSCFHADGSLDTSFGEDGYAQYLSFSRGYDFQISLDHKIYVFGSFDNDQSDESAYFSIMRFTPEGMPDITFSTNGAVLLDLPWHYSYYQNALTLTADGKAMLTGAVYNPVNNSYDFMLAKYILESNLYVEDMSDGKTLFYPNPAVDVVNFTKDVAKTELFTIDGKRVYCPFSDNKADVSQLVKGIYLMNFETSDGVHHSAKLIRK
ncbi:hypothetical protein HYN48_09700 [Flavobacterium magnum]|uniref:Secretion system C-terminal sorting domain-containing protein n=1 Tax=Flavobacterium magnum TaxID=2162713 RepID=A0A2S0RGH9_9FLAO|nr:T9SS type A sorting domain-containing protein [Flavobacterium magnum]AWA30338.1 hypothetical protein HYN48_09700 [Flavobacterium magnum]